MRVMTTTTETQETQRVAFVFCVWNPCSTLSQLITSSTMHIPPCTFTKPPSAILRCDKAAAFIDQANQLCWRWFLFIYNVCFDLAPHALNRIQLRRVWRKIFESMSKVWCVHYVTYCFNLAPLWERWVILPCFWNTLITDCTVLMFTALSENDWAIWSNDCELKNPSIILLLSSSLSRLW